MEEEHDHPTGLLHHEEDEAVGGMVFLRLGKHLAHDDKENDIKEECE